MPKIIKAIASNMFHEKKQAELIISLIFIGNRAEKLRIFSSCVYEQPMK